MRHEAYWSFNLYPAADEGGGCFVPTLRPRPVNLGPAADPERSQQEAARRARGQLRRYCAANRLNRFATLTYAGPGLLRPRAAASGRRGVLPRAEARAGPEAAAVCVGTGVASGRARATCAFAVGRYVKQRLIADVWGRGIAHIKLIGDLPVGSGALEEARVAAGYLAKYVSKSIGDERVPRLHRYEVAQGFQPEKVALRADSEQAVVAVASERMGAWPARVWRSADQEGWQASPAYRCAWAG